MNKFTKHRILKKEHEHLPETRPFITKKGGHVTGTPNFVYLETKVHFTLQDKHDIAERLKKENQVMATLGFYWK